MGIDDEQAILHGASLGQAGDADTATAGAGEEEMWRPSAGDRERARPGRLRRASRGEGDGLYSRRRPRECGRSPGGRQATIFIAAKFRVLPADADRWPDITGDFTGATRTEPGCLWFDWSRSLALTTPMSTC